MKLENAKLRPNSIDSLGKANSALTWKQGLGFRIEGLGFRI